MDICRVAFMPVIMVACLGALLLSGCAAQLQTPSISIAESLTVITPADGSKRKISSSKTRLVVNGQKIFRLSSGECVAENTLLVNVTKRMVGDVDVTLPKLRVSRYPTLCPAGRAVEEISDNTLEMEVEETWYIDQVRKSQQDEDAVVVIGLSPLMLGTSTKIEQGECKQETLSLEKVSSHKMEGTDLTVPMTIVETSVVPCPKP
ncbi:MAG: hypothetical protein RIR70_1308 [Pseudomonadota bacterium]|jgi:hypothetical protein